MPTPKEEEDLRRAQEVKLFMESPVFVEAMAGVRAKFDNDLRTCDFKDDPSALVRCRYQLEALDELELQLKRQLQTGTLIVVKSEQRAEMDDFLEDSTLPAQ